MPGYSHEDKEETARWEAAKQMEEPADISGISMEMHEQKLGRVEVTPYEPAPAADISDYKMETIRGPGSAGPMVAFAVLVVVVLILVLVWS